MRFTGIFVILSFLAAGTVSAGLVDVQQDSSIAPNVPFLVGEDLGWTQAPWQAGDGSLSGSFIPSWNNNGADLSFPAWEGSGVSLEAAPLDQYITPSGDYILYGEQQLSDPQAFLPTSVVFGDENREGETYSPRRLRMPEPLSLAIWAILGAAWAGLAWHRRPSHRTSQWPDGGVAGEHIEEGGRWSKQNRQAILNVINKTRD